MVKMTSKNINTNKTKKMRDYGNRKKGEEVNNKEEENKEEEKKKE